MSLVDKQVTDLISGYEKIQKAQGMLTNTWRPRLLAAYAQRRQLYEQSQAQNSKRDVSIKRLAWIGFGLGILMLAAGFFLGFVDLLFGSRQETVGVLLCLSPLLILTGFAIGGTAAVAGVITHARSKPRPPQDPIKAGLLQPLLPLWWQGMRGKLPALSLSDEDGTAGEHIFISRLQQLLDDSYFILYGIQQRRGEDIDTVVVGPKGVWVFEVKYWSGTIAWRNGKWARSKTYRGPGGKMVTEPKEVYQPPDEQWRRTSGDVAETIRRRVPGLGPRLSTLTKIRGGIVFTHPDATIKIAEDAPFSWGRFDDWEKRLSSAPTVPGLNEKMILQMLDVLLTRHHWVDGFAATRSMDSYAQDLIQKTEARLSSWVG